MMRESILKENIDGEALQWAVSRLLSRPEDRRILVVISDGMPVDNSTLAANYNDFLDQHLRQVINQIEGAGVIELLAIGIGHDVRDYYQHAVTIASAEELCATLTEQLMVLFSQDSSTKR